MKGKRIIILGVIATALAVVAVVIYWPASRGDPNSSDPDDRLAAVLNLTGQTGEGPVRTLRRLSRDAEPRVAVAAVRAIAADKRDRNRQILSEIVAKAERGAVRGAAAAELGAFPQTDARILIDVLAGDPSSEARAGAAKGLSRAAKGLSRLRKADAMVQLVKALEDPDRRVRLWAITALSRITALRFIYYADKKPASQQQNIARIKQQLRDRCGYKG